MKTKTKVVYCAYDGTEFFDEEECCAYEFECKAEAGHNNSVLWFDANCERLNCDLQSAIDGAWYAVIVNPDGAKELLEYCYDEWDFCFLRTLAKSDLKTGVVYSWNENGDVFDFTAKVKKDSRANAAMLDVAKSFLENF